MMRSLRPQLSHLSSLIVSSSSKSPLASPLLSLPLTRAFASSALPAAPLSVHEKDKHVPYDKIAERLRTVRQHIKGPLTLTEKIIYGHLDNPADAATLQRGKSYLKLRPDRVAMQDATAQMAVLQFVSSGLPTTAVPTTIHCDHLIEAEKQGVPQGTWSVAVTKNKEVYDFLASGCRQVRHGLLEAGQRHHPPDRAGELRLPWRPDDRHRLAHSQRRGAGHGGGGGGRVRTRSM